MNPDQTILQEGIPLDQVHIVRLENTHLRIDVSPETGGRIVSIFQKPVGQQTTGLEYLWVNQHIPLRRVAPGEPYDPNFYGGIDEVIPGDSPETIGQLDCPDHGELWTLPLQYQVEGETLVLHGHLPRWGLLYQKQITLRQDAPWIDLDYRIENLSNERRVFLWKLHAAAIIAPGDRILCPANSAVTADPQWSRWKTKESFPWPWVQGKRADLIPPADNTTDFLFLYSLRTGQVGIQRTALGCELSITFDPLIFRYVCYFASYGGFDGHYTAVLEPCTAMPVSVNAAAQLNQCSILEAGAHLTTRVSIYAGPMIDLVA